MLRLQRNYDEINEIVKLVVKLVVWRKVCFVLKSHNKKEGVDIRLVQK